MTIKMIQFLIIQIFSFSPLHRSLLITEKSPGPSPRLIVNETDIMLFPSKNGTHLLADLPPH